MHDQPFDRPPDDVAVVHPDAVEGGIVTDLVEVERLELGGQAGRVAHAPGAGRDAR